MSTRQTGNRHENAVCKFLEETYNYYTYPSRGSRGIDVIGMPAELPGDDPECVFGFLPFLGLEIGTASKSVTAAFKKIHASPQYPGMAMMVVRRIKVKGRYRLRWHVEASVRGHDSFMDAIAAWREL